MPFLSLRILLGALCVLFALPLGRSVIRVRQGRERQSKVVGWAIRVLLTGAVVMFRVGFDVVIVVVLGLAILSCAAGAYLEWRPKHHDALEKVMFPSDQG